MATTSVAVGQEAELLPGKPVDLRRAGRVGIIAAIVAAFVTTNGMVAAFAERDIVAGRLSLTYLMLAGIVVGLAYLAASPPPQLEGYAPTPPGVRNVLAGLITGGLSAALYVGYIALMDAVELRSVFVNLSPQSLELVTFHRGLGTGAGLLVALGVLGGLVGGALHLLPRRVRRVLGMVVLWVFVTGMLQIVFGQLFRGAGLPGLERFLYDVRGGLSGAGAVTVAALTAAVSSWSTRPRRTLRETLGELPAPRRRAVAAAAIAVGLVILAALPQILGQFLSNVVDLAGIFLLMALGLNVVVGYAGLLDLGYVAFFAVGAYSIGILTTQAELYRFTPGLPFLAALPFAIIMTMVAGVLVAVPVLRMRGDYLAIVTLGFGEIARLTFLSDWLKPYTGGAQGIIRIPPVRIGPIDLGGPDLFQNYAYLVLGFIVIAAYVSWALRDSRIGRAWMAMREDETVAEAMGVDIVGAKIRAFVVGAALASLGGAVFASMIQSIFPHSFNIIVSITILVIIIVGGMGSIPGVVVGALVLVGLPELLREFEEFRFLLYGALLILMMLKRPEGFIPSKIRQRELHQEEALQDAWLRAAVEEQEAAAPAGGSS